jgi:hypothetical protein
MQRKNLLLVAVMTTFISASWAQKSQEPITGFAITSSEKGGRTWKEVKMINMQTGEVIKPVFTNSTKANPLNARTKKPVTVSPAPSSGNSLFAQAPMAKKVVNLDDELSGVKEVRIVRTVHVSKVDLNLPFATNSAAMAYDKRHERLYYTPMGINQLRYIDLKSGNVFYFENESFGKVTNYGDVKNQITRMVIASDGNGYALSNNGEHLIKFTTGKKPVITDLGAVTQAATSAGNAIKMSNLFGGDMIADASGNLYLITANRNVFKIEIDSRTATHMGQINGLPKGYSTNGAMVEEGSKVIVCSSESTDGYYRFDLNTLQSEKVSTSGNVYNAADLANGVLAFEKKKKKDKKREETEPAQKTTNEVVKTTKTETINESGMRIKLFPNPVTEGFVRVSLTDHPAGRYQVQLLDMSGKMVHSRAVNVYNKNHIEEIRLPDVAKGNYVVKVINEKGEGTATEKIVIQ